MKAGLSWITTNYANFQGRASRSECWIFLLFYYALVFVMGMVDGFAGTYNSTFGIGAAYGVTILVFFLPALAVQVRRLHDTNRSGWWVLISFIPIVGIIWLIVLLVLAGSPGTNRFGPNPLAPVPTEEIEQA